MIVDFGDYLTAYLGGLAVLFAAVTANELVRRWRNR